MSSRSDKTTSSTLASWWPAARHFLGGYASGCALVVVGHPFDTIKVRLQSEGVGGRFKGPLSCLRDTVKREGLLAVYKGVTPPLLATGAVNSVLFGLQGVITRQMVRWNDGAVTRNPTVSETCQSAVVSGFLISSLVAPMEGIKARLQTQYNSAAGESGAYAGPLDCIKQVYRKLGLWNGIYRGWLPTALCRMSNYAYFGAYAFFREQLLAWQQSRSPDPQQVQSLSPGWSILAGGGAGVCYWLSCYPVDVVKNRIQAAPDTHPPRYTNMRACIREIWAKEGIRGFFSGFTPCALRAVPANAACFLTFEIAMSLLPEQLE